MKIICVDEDHPGVKDLLKKCRGLSDVEEASGFSSIIEAVDYYNSHESDLLILDVDDDAPRVRVKTFGNFEIFIDGQVVKFHRSKSKEVFAYLIDRQGSGATRAEIFAALYEDDEYDRPKQKQLDVIIRSLKDTLREYHIEYTIEVLNGSLRVVPEKVDCDLYRFFEGDEEAATSYRGEYMSNYAWAMMTEAYIDQSMILRR